MSSALSRSRRRDVIKILQQDSLVYSSDPIFKLAEAVYATYDFEEIKTQFKAAKDALKKDFFLAGFEPEFTEYFRRAIMDNAISCHSSFSLVWIKDLLSLENGATEWIENHISRLSHVSIAGENKDCIVVERTTNPNAINNAFTLKREVYERFKALSHSIETTEKFLSDSQRAWKQPLFFQ